ncbi:MAG: anthranilate synthase component I family protein [Pyrobaculum sp.]
MWGRAYFKSDLAEVYVEGPVAEDLGDVVRHVERGGVAVGLFVFEEAFWDSASAVRRRAAWPGNLFILGRAVSPPARRGGCRGVRLGGLPEGEFLRAVAAAKEALARGEVFQLVLARFEKYEVDCGAFELLSSLSRYADGRYYFALEVDGLALAGVSPEVLARVEGRRVLSGPIGGTRPRGASPAEDSALERELVESVKERAEHVMLVDSVRNDLGRVCAWGSVRPLEVLKVEKYSYVQHLVSYVECVLDKRHRPLDVVRALNPTTTVSGVPKPRALELISQLEPEPRGPFAGSVGIATRGILDFAVVIRSIYAEGSTAYVWAGAGVVMDSDPVKELRETEVKMSPLKRALGAPSS